VKKRIPLITWLKNKKLYPLYLVLLTLCILGGDHAAGPYIEFPILLLLPVSLLSWYNKFGWGLFLSISLPIVHFFFELRWNLPWTILEMCINTAVYMIVFSVFAYLINRVAAQTQELTQEVRILRGILPICCFCKRIRTKDNSWVKLEQYISEHSEAQFSHGVCPECGEKYYGEYLSDQPGKNES